MWIVRIDASCVTVSETNRRAPSGGWHSTWRDESDAIAYADGLRRRLAAAAEADGVDLYDPAAPAPWTSWRVEETQPGHWSVLRDDRRGAPGTIDSVWRSRERAERRRSWLAAVDCQLAGGDMAVTWEEWLEVYNGRNDDQSRVYDDQNIPFE